MLPEHDSRRPLCTPYITLTDDESWVMTGDLDGHNIMMTVELLRAFVAGRNELVARLRAAGEVR